ncbi:MAG: putative ABC exporter domain-containing protein [Planctomycetota bacterium]
MIDRALVYLLAKRFQHWIGGIVRRPRRLVGFVLLIALFVTMVVAQQGGADHVQRVDSRQAVLVSVLALYLVLAVFGGLGEPGLGFKPADLDYVLPGPFRRREVLVYYLARNYGQVLVLGLMYVVFLGGAGLPRPVWAYVAIVLCLGVCAHLQALSTLVASATGDRVYARLRRVTRIVLIGALAIGAVLALVGIAGAADVPGVLMHLLATPLARVLLYPALAAGRLAVAPDVAAMVGPLGGLLATLAGTFVVLLLFPVDHLESAYLGADRKQRAEASAGGRAGRRRSARGSALFRGAGAVAWLNLLMLGRRLRMIVGLVAMLVVVLLIAGSRAASRGQGGPTALLGVLAFFPLIANVPLGFRGLREHLSTLKTLPLTPGRLARAQVTVPALVIWIVQGIVLVIFTILGRLAPTWLAASAAAYLVLDVGVITVIDLYQMGHDRRELGFLTTTLQMLTIVASLLPAALVGALVLDATGSVPLALTAAVGVHVAVDALHLHALGGGFARLEADGDAS